MRARVRLASLRLRAQARHAIAARGLGLPQWAIGISRLFSEKEKPEVNTAAAAFLMYSSVRTPADAESGWVGLGRSRHLKMIEIVLMIFLHAAINSGGWWVCGGGSG